MGGEVRSGLGGRGGDGGVGARDQEDAEEAGTGVSAKRSSVRIPAAGSCVKEVPMKPVHREDVASEMNVGNCWEFRARHLRFTWQPRQTPLYE
jgi:hypothetical protein